MKQCLRAAGISMCLILFSGCVQEPSPFDPRIMQLAERSQDTQTKRQPMYPLPTTQESQYVPGESIKRPRPLGETGDVTEGPPIRMSLQELVHRAILNSYDIRVAGYDTAVDQTRVMEAEARFDPSFFTNINFERVDKESPGTFSSFDPVFTGPPTNIAFFNQSDTTTFQTGFQQDLPAGGQAKVQYQVVNSWTSPQQTTLATFYENELELTITQPLLQNFGVAVNRARITISENNQRVSLLDFRKTVEDTVLQIEKVYWQLVQQEEDVATLEKLVTASEETANVLFHRQQADVTAVQIQQANAATESRSELITAREQLGNLSDQLKRLMNDPNFPVSGSALITSTNDYIDTPVQFDVDDSIETGLANRLELGQQQVRIDSAEIALKVAKNNLLPQLNFQGSVTSDGVGHLLDESFSHQGDFNHIGWAAGLQFQFPLGNRAASAIWQRAVVQRQQAIDSYGTLVEQVALDVKQAARDVHSSWEALKANRNARFANEKALEGLQKQQESAVELTPEFVQLKLDTQDRLAQSEQAEHQSIYNYNFALAALEKAKGTILRYNNVILEQQQLPFDMMSKSRIQRFPLAGTK